MNDDLENLGAIPISDYYYSVTTNGVTNAISQVLVKINSDLKEQ
jgi:hypothetical protein